MYPVFKRYTVTKSSFVYYYNNSMLRNISSISHHMAETTPEQIATELNQVLQAFTSNYEKLKELRCIRQLLLHTNDLEWSTIDIPQPYHDMRRTADIISDESGNNLYLRRVESQPCIIYQYQVSTNQWQLGTSCPPSLYRFSMVYHDHLMIIGRALSRDDRATRTGEILNFVDGSWKRVLPDMPTSRSRSTAIICRHNQAVLLIVIGGRMTQMLV